MIKSCFMLSGRKAQTVATGTQSTALDAGDYAVFNSGAAVAFLKSSGILASDVSAADGFPLAVGSTVVLRIAQSGEFIGCFGSTVIIHRVG